MNQEAIKMIQEQLDRIEWAEPFDLTNATAEYETVEDLLTGNVYYTEWMDCE